MKQIDELSKYPDIIAQDSGERNMIELETLGPYSLLLKEKNLRGFWGFWRNEMELVDLGVKST